MKNGFYSRIASDNIKKNPRLYAPRILAEAGLLACFYIMFALAVDDRLAKCGGGEYISTFMWMGSVILGLLSLILILYVNSFMMKRRKNEYGLYNVLGMEKRHIIRVLFAEAIFTFTVSAALGLVCGILFYKLASLLICKLLQAEIVAGFYYINAKTLLLPVVVFLMLELFAFLINSISIRRQKTVELLSGKHTGEKEPRVKWILLIAGIMTLGAGYMIALTVESPLEAIYMFFAAVILVIIGTYCLFITGTTFVLKCLKRNKKYYYNRRHMPAVAGLLYRMKQNAVGLASIAILATGVLVMISTTVSLYGGSQDALDTNYPQQLYLSAGYMEDGKTVAISDTELKKAVKTATESCGVEIGDIKTEQFLSVSYVMRDNQLLTKAEVNDSWNTADLTGVTFVTADVYNELRGKSISAAPENAHQLQKDEIAFSWISGGIDDMRMPSSLVINGTEYKVKEMLTSFPINDNLNGVVRCIGIVVSDEDVLRDFYLAQKEAYGEHASEYTERIAVTFADEAAAMEAGKAISAAVRNEIDAYFPKGEGVYVLDAKWEAKESMLGMYGTFLFLGILLGSVFLFSTILIIYYKQISEGYEDCDRFRIMQKIGMEEREVKRTIQSQMLLQFFLPLVTAGIHLTVAFPILLKLLKLLMLSNTTLFIVCTLITFAVFALLYISVYLLTSKTYYKIVH